MDINDTKLFSGMDWFFLAQGNFSIGFQQRYIILNKPSDYTSFWEEFVASSYL